MFKCFLGPALSRRSQNLNLPGSRGNPGRAWTNSQASITTDAVFARLKTTCFPVRERKYLKPIKKSTNSSCEWLLGFLGTAMRGWFIRKLSIDPLVGGSGER